MTFAPAPPEPAPAPTSGLLLPLLQLAALGGVLAVTPYLAFDLDQHSVPKELLLQAVAWPAAWLALRHRQRITLSLLDLLLAGWAALSVISALFATNHWLALRAVALSLGGLSLFWCAATLRREGRGHALLAGLAVAGLVAAVTALLQSYGVESPLWGESRAPGGLFGNRNFMAHFVALSLPLLYLLRLNAIGCGGQLISIIGAAMAAAALVLSRSRAAWLAVAVGFVVLVAHGLAGSIWRDSEVRRRSRGFLIALGVGVIAALALPNHLEWRSDSPYLETLTRLTDYQAGSGHGRLIQYRNTLRMVEDDPVLGVGPGNWPVAYPRYTTPGDPAYQYGAVMPTNPWPSSDWVALLAERGAPAFLLLAIAGGLMLIRGWRGLSNAVPREEALEAVTLTGFLSVLAVVGAFDAVLLLPGPNLLVWPALGALIPVGRPQLSVEIGGRRLRRIRRAIAVIGVLLVVRSGMQLAAMSVYHSGRDNTTLDRAAALDPGSYRIQMSAAAIEISRHRCDLALPHIQQARRLFPTLPAPERYLRTCTRRRR
ncbi:MAG TPA: O-antigen ligase family protein [Gemmatimonadales bacterium]|nr:O-antigen ligase family protein [Gemmatimonadales bacterium]